MIHHCDQEIEKHDDVDDGEASKHDQAPEPGELLDPRQLKVVQVYEAKWRPEQCLCCLPQTTNTSNQDMTFNSMFNGFLLGKFPKGQAVIDLDDNFIIFFIGHLQKLHNIIMAYMN